MTKLTYPVKVTFVEGDSLIYKVVDFPNIVGSSSAGLHDYIFRHLYDEIENALYELAYAGEEIPRPTLISSEDRGDYIYITVPFERKEFYWNKPFMDRCIGSAVLSAFLILDLNSHQSIFAALLLWAFFWMLTFFILSFIATLTIRMQIALSFEKVSLSKRLLTIVVLSLLSALFVVLLDTAGLSEM